jgi:hypothetical protein
MTKRRKIDLAPVPTPQKADSANIATSKASVDQMITGTGSSIDIPRTALSQGAKFGEVITAGALRFATRREPAAKKLVIDVAEDIYDKWFKIQTITQGKAEEGKDTLNEKVQTVLEKLQVKKHAIIATKYEREYGWAIIVLGFKDQGETLNVPVANPTEIDHLAVYSPRSVTVETEDLDETSARFGLPVIYKVNRGKGKTFRVHFSRVLHVATRLDEDAWAGVPVLEPIWDDLTVYRNLRWASGQVYWRMPGIMKFTFPKDYTADQIKAFFATLGDPNVRTFIALPEDKDLEIMGAAGKVLDPSLFTDIALRSISMGSGIPKQKLEGTEAGAITGSEVNQREYYKYVSDQQKLYEAEIIGPLIDMMMAIGQIQPDVDYRVEWANAFQLDSKSEAETVLLQAQSDLILLKYMTIDEVRQIRGRKALTEVTSGKEDGQRLLSLLELQSRNPAGILTDSILESDKPEPPSRHVRETEMNLTRELHAIFNRYKAKGISLKDAIRLGDIAIQKHYDAVLEVARKTMSRRAGKEVTVPPEITTRLGKRVADSKADLHKIFDEFKLD